MTGSSPRVWGALLATIEREPNRRLIPTCVGSTSFTMCTEGRGSAHPHVCGEHVRE